MITHSVFFKLAHPSGSAQEQEFLAKAAELSAIDGVGNFQLLRQTGTKNNFDFGLSMQFETQAVYDAYNEHRDHVAFVQNVWLQEVVDFMEIDYEAL